MPPEPPKQFRQEDRGRAPVRSKTQSNLKTKEPKTIRQDKSLNSLPIPPLESLKIETKTQEGFFSKLFKTKSLNSNTPVIPQVPQIKKPEMKEIKIEKKPESKKTQANVKLPIPAPIQKTAQQIVPKAPQFAVPSTTEKKENFLTNLFKKKEIAKTPEIKPVEIKKIQAPGTKKLELKKIIPLQDKGKNQQLIIPKMPQTPQFNSSPNTEKKGFFSNLFGSKKVELNTDNKNSLKVPDKKEKIGIQAPAVPKTVLKFSEKQNSLAMPEKPKASSGFFSGFMKKQDSQIIKEPVINEEKSKFHRKIDVKLAEKSEKIYGLKTEVEQRIKILENKENDLKKKFLELNSEIVKNKKFEESLKIREQQIAKKEEICKNLNLKISEKEESTKKIESNIQQREKALEKQLSQVQSMKDSLMKKQNEIDRIEKTIEDRKSIMKELENRENSITKGEAQLKADQEKLRSWEKKLNDSEIDLRVKEKTLKGKELELMSHAKELNDKELKADRKLSEALEAKKDADAYMAEKRKTVEKEITSKLKNIAQIEKQIKEELKKIEQRENALKSMNEIKSQLKEIQNKYSNKQKTILEFQKKEEKLRAWEEKLRSKDAEIRNKEKELDKQIDLLLDIKRPAVKEKITSSEVNELIEECNRLAASGHYEDASEIYKEIQELYDGLDAGKKKELYVKIYDLYNKINLGMIDRI